MNYTKLVREYCKNNSGAIFDVSKLKDTEFTEVPYKTLLKILNRLEEECLLSAVSKGVYFIGEKPVDEELIFDEYVDDGKGMFVVYQKGYPNGIPCNMQTAKAWGLNEGDLFKCEPYLQIKMTNGSHAMWVPSINDILAEDWDYIH